MNTVYKVQILALTFLMSGCGAAPRRADVVEEVVEESVQAPAESATKAGSNLIVLETEAQLNDLIASSKLILVDFFAPWCGPCKQFLSTLEKVAPEFSNVIFVKVNVDDFRVLASQYGVSSIPSIKIYANGDITKSVQDFTGSKSPADLRKLLKELGA